MSNIDQLRQPAARHRPGRDRRSGSTRSTRSSTPRARSGPATSCRALTERARERQVGTPAEVRRPTSTPSPPRSSRGSPATSTSSGASGAFIRWNAAVMVVNANKHADGIGGHLSTFASSAALYEVGFNHFFRGKDDGLAGDHVYFQGHAAPGIYARAFLEGRLDERQLDNFRREIGGDGPVELPAPAAHARLLGVPHGVDGPRPASTRSTRPASTATSHNRRIDDTAEQPGVVLPRRRRVRRARDARLDLARRPRAARQPHLGRQLQPPAPRRPGARQRQDHPGARGRLPRRRLERHQGDLGRGLGRAARPRRRRRAARTR